MKTKDYEIVERKRCCDILSEDSKGNLQKETYLKTVCMSLLSEDYNIDIEFFPGRQVIKELKKEMPNHETGIGVKFTPIISSKGLVWYRVLKEETVRD